MLARPSPAAGPSQPHDLAADDRLAAVLHRRAEDGRLGVHLVDVASAARDQRAARPRVAEAGDGRGDLVGERGVVGVGHQVDDVRADAGLLAGRLGAQLRELALDRRGADGRHGRRHRRRSRATQLVGRLGAPRAGLVEVRRRRPGAPRRRAAAARSATTPPPRPGAGSWCRRRAWRRAAASRTPRRAAPENAVSYWKSMLTVRIWIRSDGTLAPNRSEMPSFGLDPQHEHVRLELLGRRVRERQVRHALELDRDLGDALRQPLAGAKVERRVGPAPVVDVQARRDVGLDVGVGRDAVLLAVAAHRLAVGVARRVLAAHDVGRPQRPARHAAPCRARRAPPRRRTTPAAPSPRSSAPAACGSARCRAARRPPRRSGRAPRRRSTRPP